jgi:hypothetical protein
MDIVSMDDDVAEIDPLPIEAASGAPGRQIAQIDLASIIHGCHGI